MTLELKNRAFYRKTLHLMLPVVLQQLITIGINFLDNIMVGGFGETQISAVSFGNQFYSFFQFICMGLGSGAIVMSSQFWGRKETEPMKVAAAMALRLTAVLCAVFTAVCVIFPGLVLRLFTADGNILSVGAPYVRLIGVTFIFAGLSSTATYLLRSIGQTRVPLIGSLIAFFLNLFFNWVFIYGKFGAPRLELVGAAVGTIIARLFEFCFVFGYFIFKDGGFGFRPKHLALSGKTLRGQYIKYSIPVLVSDTSLGLSLTITTMIIGHLGEEISAANAIVLSAMQILTVLNMGMSGASAITVGNTIGEGDIPRAKREGATYVVIAFILGLIAVPLFLLLENPYLSLYNIGGDTRAIAHGMIVIICCMMPVQTVAYVTSKGILRGGGDTRFLLIADSSLIWLVSIPLGALAAFLWHMSPLWVFFLIRVEYPLKGIVCFIRFCTGKWVKEIKAAKA